MSEHYYSKNPKVKSNRKEWRATLRGKTLHFTTDTGVFSRGEVDFGSRLLIETFKHAEVAGDILDIGCGYGPIGLSIAASSPGKVVHLVDVNERALELCRNNATQNKIENVEIYQSEALAEVTGSFASVLTNPPIRAGKDIVFQFYEEAFEKILSGGELWVVIQKKQGAPSTATRLEELFGNVETVVRKKGYYIFKSVKA